MYNRLTFTFQFQLYNKQLTAILKLVLTGLVPACERKYFFRKYFIFTCQTLLKMCPLRSAPHNSLKNSKSNFSFFLFLLIQLFFLSFFFSNLLTFYFSFILTFSFSTFLLSVFLVLSFNYELISVFFSLYFLSCRSFFFSLHVATILLVDL